MFPGDVHCAFFDLRAQGLLYLYTDGERFFQRADLYGDLYRDGHYEGASAGCEAGLTFLYHLLWVEPDGSPCAVAFPASFSHLIRDNRMSDAGDRAVMADEGTLSAASGQQGGIGAM